MPELRSYRWDGWALTLPRGELRGSLLYRFGSDSGTQLKAQLADQQAEIDALKGQVEAILARLPAAPASPNR